MRVRSSFSCRRWTWRLIVVVCTTISPWSKSAVRAFSRTAGTRRLQPLTTGRAGLRLLHSASKLPVALEKHAPGHGPLLQGPCNDDDEKKDAEFKFNVGRAMDYLACDVPLMFMAPPRLEIFTTGVVLKDPVGELCHGRRLYGALHTSLRVLSAVTAVKPCISVTSVVFNQSRREIELKWTMGARAPLIGETAVKMNAVSVYRVDEHGFIEEHAIDNRIKRDLWEYSHSWMGMLAGDRPPSA